MTLARTRLVVTLFGIAVLVAILAGLAVVGGPAPAGATAATPPGSTRCARSPTPSSATPRRAPLRRNP